MAVFTGSEGPDALTGSEGIDQVFGGGGNDVLAGRDGSDLLDGGAGDDVLYGWGEADRAGDSGLISAVRVASGFAAPVFAAAPPGQPDRLYVLEKDEGRIRVLDLATGRVGATPFLDLAQTEFSGGGERGVLGLAFHPDYAANGRLFVYLTTPAGDLQLREYARAADGASVDPASGRVLLTVPHPNFSNHNGGFIGFGPDGLLYVNTGDGGGGGDPNNNAQNLNSLLGKVLRLDVGGDGFPNDPGRNYLIPSTNPFVGREGADEIFAFGLRNPYRASFDRLTGDFYIGDVGEGQREEVDLIRAGSPGGQNFGWRVKEGFAVFSPGTPPGPNAPGLVDPILDYGRDAGGGRSVTGGVVNRGPGGAQGLYVFGDFVSGNLFSARVVDGAAQDFTLRNAQVRADVGSVNLPAAFVEDGSGRVYLVGFDGEIHRLDFSPAAGDGADLLLGGAGNDRIHAGAGNDRAGGQDGDDLIEGGLGDDQLFGDAGDDAIGGQAGNDLVVGGSGRDRLYGDDGDDAVGGQEDADLIEGGRGADRLFGDGGDDLVGGQDGNDRIEGNLGNDRLFGDAGDDLIGAGEGADFVNGGAGRDVIFGENGNDQLEGGTDDDRIFGDAGEDAIGGQEGNDFINGGSGRDLLFGEAGNDHLEGGTEDDALFGDAGDDLMGGQDGNDQLFGGGGADTLFGDAGDDVIVGGAGNDRLDGGSGLDTAVFTGARAGYSVTTAGGVTTVSGADGTDVLVGFEQLRFDDGVFGAAGPPAAPDWVA